MTEVKVFEVAGGEIRVWSDKQGAICIKTLIVDPVELADHEAIELSNLLRELVRQNGGVLS